MIRPSRRARLSSMSSQTLFRNHASAPGPHAHQQERSQLDRNGFWTMLKRFVLCAIAVDVGLFGLFRYFNAPVLAWSSIAGIAINVFAYGLLDRRINKSAVALIGIGVFAHATLGTLEIGWDSGFHYYLLMFILGIAVRPSRSLSTVLVAALLGYYLALNLASYAFGPLVRLADFAITTVLWINIAIVFSVCFYLARFYLARVVDAERRLRFMATRDPLTGLSNRRHLLSIAKQEIGRIQRTHAPLSVVMADIDFFKRINDDYGHEAGDRVLAHAGRLFQQMFRESDVVSRWGGEEFLVLLPNTDMQAARPIVERLRNVVADTIIHNGTQPIRFTMSFGLATYGQAESIMRTIARADQALYRSKTNGRNRVSSS